MLCKFYWEKRTLFGRKKSDFDHFLAGTCKYRENPQMAFFTRQKKVLSDAFFGPPLNRQTRKSDPGRLDF